jgi:hypothetical protein
MFNLNLILPILLQIYADQREFKNYSFKIA